jgi:CheY-like chemotaxis protein
MAGVDHAHHACNTEPLTGIAHDLNNLLLAIALNVESLARECPETVSTRPLVDGARQGIEEARALIGQLLALTGHQPSNPVRTGVAGLPNAVSGETVLLVEDTQLVRNAVARMLRDLGYRALAAASAREALDLLGSDRRIDLLFTDMMLPGGLDGADLAAAARRLRPGLSVLCTSGGGEIALAAADPRFGRIAKPYTKAELAAQLRAVLGGKAATG